MKKLTLVIMAAGIGSRFGGGIKQLEAVGSNGEIIMDYSIYDALEAGFNKVVFVIRKKLEKDFKKIIGYRIEKIVETEYAYQEVTDIPDKYKEKYKNRIKPWGTGQAILSCKDLINAPFVVINADDYYGKEAFFKAYQFLNKPKEGFCKVNIGMVGFVLKNTLSNNGGVTRGICSVGADRMLKKITETHNIRLIENNIVADFAGKKIRLNAESIVSMNMWALPTDIFPILKSGFDEFLEHLDNGETEEEYLLPIIFDKLLLSNKITVEVLESRDEWFGVTYKEDKYEVMKKIQKLIENNSYSGEFNTLH